LILIGIGKRLVEATKDLNVPVILATRPKRVTHLQPLPSHVTVKQFNPRELVQEYAKSAVIVVPLDTSARNNDAMGCSTLFEGMAVGKPVIITRTKTTETYVRNGENGILVEEKNPEALKKALQTLLDNPELRKSMGKKAYEYAQSHLDVRACTRQLADFFKKIFK
jgi:glycosyltransferase involved in cell wall biosynthesis